MVKKEHIDNFLALQKIAVIGVSRNPQKFGVKVLEDLAKKHYTVYGINPQAGEINGTPIYADINATPEKPDGVVFVVPPFITEKVLDDVKKCGINHVWLQQGAESEAAIQFCRDNNINVVYGQCIMMHAGPVESVHKMHRFVNRLFGKLPK